MQAENKHDTPSDWTLLANRHLIGPIQIDVAQDRFNTADFLL